MEEINLVICDKEICYANRLADNISMRRELNVRVFTCSNISMAIKLQKEIHILVVDESCRYEERCQIHAKQTYVLGRGKIIDKGEKETAIFKYQCADEIIRRIFQSYVEHTNANIMRSAQAERTRMIAVYSPIHRVGKTKFAISLGKEYAKSKRVLYLNLEEYAGFGGGEHEGLHLGDLLYYIKQGNQNLGSRLQAAANKMEQLDYIDPIVMVSDLKDVTQEEWEKLFHQIGENSNYDYVILDLGDSVQGLFAILARCDKIYMPILEDEVSQRKINRYYQNLEQLKLEQVIRNTYRFIMPDDIEEYAKIRVKEET